MVTRSSMVLAATLVAAGVVAGSVFTVGGFRKPVPAATTQRSSSQAAGPQEPAALSLVSEVVAAGDPTPLGGTHGTAGGESPVTLGVVVGSGHQVAFVGRVIGGPHRRLLPDYELVDYTGVFRFDGHSISALAIEGDRIPTLQNPAVQGPCWFEPSAMFAINPAGQVVMTGTAAGNGYHSHCRKKAASGGWAPSGLVQGIFMLNGGPPVPIVVEGDPALGGFVPGGFPQISEIGSVLFSAGRGSTPETARLGLFLSSGGSVSKVVAQGDPSPVGGAFGPVAGGGNTLFPGFQIDNRNEIIFWAQVGQGNGIFSPTGKIVASGDTAPGGGKFGQVGVGPAPMSMNADGLILFTADVVGAGGSSSPATFITSYQGGGAAIKRVAAEGWPVTPVSSSGEAVFQLPNGEFRLYRLDGTGKAEDRGRLPQGVAPLAVASDGAVLAVALTGNPALLFVERGSSSLCSFQDDEAHNRPALDEWKHVRLDFAGELLAAWGDGGRPPAEKQALRDIYAEIYDHEASDWSKKFVGTMVDAILTPIGGGVAGRTFKVGFSAAVAQSLEGNGLEKAASEVGGQLLGAATEKVLGAVVDKPVEALGKAGVEELVKKVDASSSGDFALLTRPPTYFIFKVAKGNPSFVGVTNRLGCGKYAATISVKGKEGRQVIVSMGWEYKKNGIGAWVPVFSPPTVLAR